MEFHHRDPEDKIKDVAYLVVSSYAWDTILKEIEKCDLVCVCCHRIRTFGGKEIALE
jgi:L-lysine 2,3-aminomutase